MELKKTTALSDLIIIILFTCILFGISFHFDAFERFISWSRQYEHWEIDELIMLSIIMAVMFALYSFRRWNELREREIALYDALKEVELLARTDALTGLYNRRYFLEFSRRDLEISSRYSIPFSILMLDIDHFKAVNDTYGHATGDVVLKNVASILLCMTRSTDIVARYGGEEFVILFSLTELKQAVALAERLREKIADETFFSLHGGKISLTVSIGVTQWTPGTSKIEDMIERADTALYKAKRAGRNRIATQEDV